MDVPFTALVPWLLVLPLIFTGAFFLALTVAPAVAGTTTASAARHATSTRNLRIFLLRSEGLRRFRTANCRPGRRRRSARRSYPDLRIGSGIGLCGATVSAGPAPQSPEARRP